MAIEIGKVVSYYKQQKPNPYHGGDVRWENSGRRIYCNGPAIYSYGSHFPLASILGKHQKTGEFIFVKNGDRWVGGMGVTTRHQGECQHQLNGPTLSFSAIRGAGLDPLSLKLENIVDYGTDTRTDCYRDKDGKLWSNVLCTTPFEKPKQGMFIGTSDSDLAYRLSSTYYYEDDEKTFLKENEIRPGVWHILGGVLLRVKTPEVTAYNWRTRSKDTTPARDASFLCALDEGSYFCAQLPGHPKTIEAAITSLRPVEVEIALLKGKEVKRQGEWFFVRSNVTFDALKAEMGLTKTALLKLLQKGPLESPGDYQDMTSRMWVYPLKEDGSFDFDATPEEVKRTFRRRVVNSNRHMAKWVTVKGRGVLATGVVRHWDDVDNEQTGEHVAVDLGDATKDAGAVFYEVYKNTEKGSWRPEGSGGRVD